MHTTIDQDTRTPVIDTPFMRSALARYAARMVPGRGPAEMLLHRVAHLRGSWCVVFVHDALTGNDTTAVSMHVSVIAAQARAHEPDARGGAVYVMCGDAATLRASHPEAFNCGVKLCPRCGSDLKLCTVCPNESGGPLQVCTSCDPSSHAGHETLRDCGGTFAGN